MTSLSELTLQQGYVLQSYYSHITEYQYIITTRLRITVILRNTGISLQDL